MQSNKFPAPAELVDIMQSYAVKYMCYVLSQYADEGFDGEYVPLVKVAEKLFS